MTRALSISMLLILLLGACQASVDPQPSEYFAAAEWRHEDGQDASYLLAPGDTLQVIFHTAPELDRETRIAPDGSISLPYVGAVQASARSAGELRENLIQAYGSELKDPDIDVIPTGFDSQQIFVGGEVQSPGLMPLPGQIDPLQAIIMAGGFTDQAQPRQVALMRRMPGGEIVTAVFDIKKGINDPRLSEWTPLRRFDVVYVPRSAIAEENLLMQQWFRAALPVQFSLYYDISGDIRGR
ncbi:polysaccharide biosynthesis/export family protein [Henriciella aquimarina]|uniref:polysaccharide biosynthesis/export family protein n=1 Tax=Henriciella aquimarina TaxID=545261 RepID=UPI000A00D268|nr:polysaccharide biosynthesis/export family protein [Henriciella aquimarina]